MEIKKGHEVLVSKLPKCDLCSEEGIVKDAEFDGKTVFGPWANMCDIHWITSGVGITGVGRGQKLILKES